jgi:uncharacterized protein YbjT (DUF2867 family)
MSRAEPVVAVLGATGAQGGGVVDSLLAGGGFRVRAAVRNPNGDAAKSLAKRGCEVVRADILDIASMRPVFEGAQGAFLVTNFWDPAQMSRSPRRVPPSKRRRFRMLCGQCGRFVRRRPAG